MNRGEVKEILDRVLNWPPEDQEKLVCFVRELELWREGDEIYDLGHEHAASNSA